MRVRRREIQLLDRVCGGGQALTAGGLAVGRHVARTFRDRVTSLRTDRRLPCAHADWQRPARHGFMVAAATFGLLGTWAATARIDSAVIAQGSIVVESDRKAVQHLEGGIVGEILIRDGQEVATGQVLLRLDPTQMRAQRSVARLTVFNAMAEEARLLAEAEGSERIAFPTELADEVGSSEARRAILDQSRQFRERRTARALEVSILEERLAQLERQVDGTAAQRNAAASQAASIAEETEKLRPLAEKGLIATSRISVLDRSRSELAGRTGSLAADLRRLARGIEEARMQVLQVDRKVVEEAASRLSDTRSRLAEAREKLRIADDVLGRADIVAPRLGRIVGLKVHTVGAVIRSGDTLMEIVPGDDDLVVSAKMSPADVNTVHAGLAAEVRLPSFKQRETPIAIGEVRSVAADALRDDVTRQVSYELRVSVQVSRFPAHVRAKLKPGMPAEVIIATGERTVLTYLTQPLTDALRIGMREN